MRRVPACWLPVLLTAALLPGLTAAQDGGRPFCDDNDPLVTCTDDSLEVVFPVFGANDDSTFAFNEFVAGTTIDARVVLDAVNEGIQGWSYGVKHDEAFLELDATSVTTAGTDVERVFDNGFDITEAVDGGFISAVVLSMRDPVVLPVGRNVVVKATYTLTADPGAAGTVIELVSEEIGPVNSPATPIVITIGGNALQPRRLVDGVVRRLEVAREECTNGMDDDGDGLIDLEDPDCFDCPCPGGPAACDDFGFFFGADTTTEVVDARGAASFSITSRNVRPLLAFQLGVGITPEGDDFSYGFSGMLGTDPNRLIELLMTDNEGNSVTPVATNRVLSDTDGVISIQRGAALQGFAGGDFLEFDLQPDVGGPGFFVGYVSDLDNDIDQIPVTGPDTGQGCPVNELLTVNIGAADCPGFAYYFGDVAAPGEVDARGLTTFAISSRNVDPILAFQFGVRTTEQAAGGVLYEFADDLGTDDQRLIEILMTDDMGNSIFPATPNTILAADSPVSLQRGSALAGFDPGDFFNFDLNPLQGGPGFFVGYVSDLDGNANQIPATPVDDTCPLNELVVVSLEVPVCPDFGFAFGSAAIGGTVDARGASRFVVSGRNSEPLLAFQVGVAIRPDGDDFRFSFSGDLGTDPNRLIELLMTTDMGDSRTPLSINDLISDMGTISSVARGSAIAGFDPGDFFDFDINPGVGGPGFFVGYVSDLDDNANQIPATGPEGEDCPLNELLVVNIEGPVCPDDAFLFGSEATGGTVDLGDERSFAISSRNSQPLLAYQLGVSIRPDGDGFRYAFSGDLGTDENRLIELLMTTDMGESVTPRTPNELLAVTDTVIAVDRGTSVAGFDPGDFLDVDTNPGVGGPGFFLGYVSDLDNNVNQIPATAPANGECPLNELLVVTLAPVGAQPFFRGDADGTGRLSVTDAVIIIQTAIMPMTFAPRFDCDDLRDVNDDEMLAVSDAVPVLAFLFQRGPSIAAPFFACEVDPTDDGPLTCRESNCVP